MPWTNNPQTLIVLFFKRMKQMHDLPCQIGLLIRKYRKEKHISQEKLALLCEIDRSYLGRIERGEVNLTVIKLYEIASILNINPKELLPEP